MVIVGDGGVGKTSLSRKVRRGEFERKYISTIGVEVDKVTSGSNVRSILNVFVVVDRLY